MPPEALVATAVLAVALALATAVAISRGNALARLREALGADRDADLEVAARRLIGAREAAAWDAGRRAADLTYLADLIGVGIVRVDDRLQVVLANQAAHALLRRPPSVVGRSAMEAFADHRLEAIVRQALERGAAGGELTLRGAEQPTLVVRARRSPVEGAWVVMEDVSELRRLQRIRTEFLDNLSHELRTPLTTIRLLTETLARDLEGAAVPPRVRERVQTIDVETGHLVQMVSELLDLAKIEQGRTALHLDIVNLGAVIHGSLDRLRLFAERQEVALVEDVPADLPAVRGDDERLGQVLINLLHNAVKFSSAGGTVTVRARAAADEVAVAVADEGMGIPAGDLRRVFERFYKVDRARVRGQGGTGLGLAIARHIVEGHGGRIRVVSVEGHGATFTFSLPVAPPEPAIGRAIGAGTPAAGAA